MSKRINCKAIFVVPFLMFFYCCFLERMKIMFKKLFGLGKKENEFTLEEKANIVFEALGGEENITNVESCITRLRITLNDEKIINKQKLHEIGMENIIEKQNEIQLPFGTESNDIKALLDGKIKTPTEKGEIHETKLFIPLEGKLLNLSEVPDEVFASKMMGDGFAIKPSNGEVVSPVDGKILSVFPTKHAISILSNEGLEILIHFGIDTVNLKGEGFDLIANEGDIIKPGQTLLKANLDTIEKLAKSTITPVIFTNLPEDKTIKFEAGIDVKAAEENIITIM